MIDLHCHILPGVDDGAVDLSDSYDMARAALADGSRIIAATSHLGESLFDTTWDLLTQAHGELVSGLEREGIGLEVFLGAENFLGDISPAKFAETARGLGPADRYVLFDFSMRRVPPHVGDAIEAIRGGGRTPIIAHPERNLELQENPSPILEWIEAGALIQVNAPSVVGLLGDEAQKAALQILQADAAHLLASDAHNVKTRPFCLKRAREAVVSLVGEIEAEEMTARRPLGILRGDEVRTSRSPKGWTPTKKTFLSRILGGRGSA